MYLINRNSKVGKIYGEKWCAKNEHKEEIRWMDETYFMECDFEASWCCFYVNFWVLVLKKKIQIDCAGS